MAGIQIRRSGQDPFEVAKNQIVAGVKKGELLADDEMSADGKKWIRLDQHKQIAPLFAKAKAPPKRKKMTEEEFYANKEVSCPKCGFEQERGESCMKCNVLFEKYWDIKKGRVKTKTQTLRTAATKKEAQAAESSGNIVQKLWRGEFPLWVTFWIFGFVLPAIVMFTGQFVVAKFFLEDIVMSTMANSAQESLPTMTEDMTQEEMASQMMLAAIGQFIPYIIAFYAIYFLYTFILNVGLWRSSSNYEGFGLWRVLVKIIVVLYFIQFPFWVGGLGWVTYLYLTGDITGILSSLSQA